MVVCVVKEYAHVLQDSQVDKCDAVKTILGVKLIYSFIYSKLKQDYSYKHRNSTHHK